MKQCKKVFIQKYTKSTNSLHTDNKIISNKMENIEDNLKNPLLSNK